MVAPWNSPCKELRYRRVTVTICRLFFVFQKKHSFLVRLLQNHCLQSLSSVLDGPTKDSGGLADKTKRTNEGWVTR